MDEDVEHILSMRIDLEKARQQERKQTEEVKRCTFNDHNGELGTSSGTQEKQLKPVKTWKKKEDLKIFGNV
nr:hypothetical protein CFP56_28368 [Quercus suber]